MADGKESDGTALFSFGVLTDSQYADADDETRIFDNQVRGRYFRNAYNQILDAIKFWNLCPENLQLVLQLGDIIDGCNRPHKSGDALSYVVKLLETFPGPVYHVIGNHELYNFSQSQLLHGPLLSPKETGLSHEMTYYSIKPHPKFCFIALDTYDCVRLECVDSSEDARLSAMVERLKNNHCDCKVYDPSCLDDINRRALRFHGSVSGLQLQWMKKELSQAEDEGRTVFVLGHQPICPGSAHPSCLCENYDDVLKVIHKYKCVVAYFAGHDHAGGYNQDHRGVHHVTFAGIVETPPGTPCFGTVHVYPDHIELKGSGRIPSMVLPFKK